MRKLVLCYYVLYFSAHSILPTYSTHKSQFYYKLNELFLYSLETTNDTRREDIILPGSLWARYPYKLQKQLEFFDHRS